jgi:DNA-directed RNA polymerase specialized sigma24 family protein
MQRTIAAFNMLPLKYREVLYLNVVDGLSYEEVANTLQTKVGTVKSRLSRARVTLQERLETTRLGKRTAGDPFAGKPYCLPLGQVA